MRGVFQLEACLLIKVPKIMIAGKWIMTKVEPVKRFILFLQRSIIDTRNGSNLRSFFESLRGVMGKIKLPEPISG